MLDHKSLHAFFLILMLLLLSACRSDSGAWDRIQESGVLRVGLDPTFPPFEETKGAGVQGLDVDLAQELANELGIKAEFVYFGYDGLYDALATNQVDVLISALVIMPERGRDFAYSEPYFNAGEILIVPQSETRIHEMVDLQNRRLAVELGSLGHVEAIEWAKRLENLEILPFGSAAEALDAVAAGQADAGLVDSISGRLYIKEQGPDQPSLNRVETPVTVEPYAAVIRIEDQKLLVNLNEALQSLKTEGRLDLIIARWLDNESSLE